MKRPTVYILRCRGGLLYVGVTSSLELRLGQHSSQVGGSFTCAHRPCELVWFQECETMEAAISLEKQLKGWRREKKIALIEGRFEDLPGLSRGCAKSRRRASTGSA